ncbi:hypothetical protein COLO4_16406 [Corchorus olitorius]|uniref:WW domain-containing protein n=1 Tax=Corchorus olitorius TaxID=93759 RepID=A0A1R3JHS2_9ROSI|nr:hypothetical protein COLO4_16406 [Corchorus olitorius]
MRKTTLDDHHHQLDNSSKKRKLDHEPHGDEEETFEKRSKAETTKALFHDMELHLETPLPLEWQRCLDIQSGQIHFYNSRTQTRTCKDPRRSPEPPSSGGGHMSLDLELNLPCDSVRKINAPDDHKNQFINSVISLSPPKGGGRTSVVVDDGDNKKINSSSTPRRSLSWLAVAEEDDEKEQEMVATVCMRCHMLVMLCKSSPACPNCKFMHPPDQGPPKLFKPRLSLLC